MISWVTFPPQSLRHYLSPLIFFSSLSFPSDQAFEKASSKSVRRIAEDSDEDIDSIPVPLSTNVKTNLSDIEKAEKAYNLKQSLIDRLESLNDRLPLNTLDELIDQLGGPDYVAELTGTLGRYISPFSRFCFKSLLCFFLTSLTLLLNYQSL